MASSTSVDVRPRARAAAASVARAHFHGHGPRSAPHADARERTKLARASGETRDARRGSSNRPSRATGRARRRARDVEKDERAQIERRGAAAPRRAHAQRTRTRGEDEERAQEGTGRFCSVGAEGTLDDARARGVGERVGTRRGQDGSRSRLEVETRGRERARRVETRRLTSETRLVYV